MKETCPYCKGSGKTFFSNKKNYTCPSCNGKGYIDVGWEKEFEDEIKLFCGMDGLEFVNKSIFEIFAKFIGKLKIIEGTNKIKVKIKCKDGCIQIERQ